MEVMPKIEYCSGHYVVRFEGQVFNGTACAEETYQLWLSSFNYVGPPLLCTSNNSKGQRIRK